MSLDTKAKLHAAIDSQQTSDFQDAIDIAKSTESKTDKPTAMEVAKDKGAQTGFRTWHQGLNPVQTAALAAAGISLLITTVLILIYFLYDPPSPSSGTPSSGTPSSGTPTTVLCNTFTDQNTCNDAFNQLDPTNKCVWGTPVTKCFDAWMITRDGTPIIAAPFDGLNITTNNHLYDSYRQGSAPSNILVEAILYEDPNGYSTPIKSVASANTTLGQQAADRRRFASKWTQYSTGGTGQVLTINIFMNDDGSFNSEQPNRTYNQMNTLLTGTNLIEFHIVGSNTLLYGYPNASDKIDILHDNSLVYSHNWSNNSAYELQNSNNSIKPIEKPQMGMVETRFIRRL